MVVAVSVAMVSAAAALMVTALVVLVAMSMLCGRAFLAMSRPFRSGSGDIWWRSMRRGIGRVRGIASGNGRGRRSVTRLAV